MTAHGIEVVHVVGFEATRPNRDSGKDSTCAELSAAVCPAAIEYYALTHFLGGMVSDYGFSIIFDGFVVMRSRGWLENFGSPHTPSILYLNKYRSMTFPSKNIPSIPSIKT